jgi:hypothetical protein
LVWGQRLREQFNHAARHAGLDAELRWGRLMTSNDPAACELLAALMKRFGMP